MKRELCLNTGVTNVSKDQEMGLEYALGLLKEQHQEIIKLRFEEGLTFKEIGERLGSEVRVTVPGHTQRGGSPCPYDRVLCTRLGSAAAKAIIDEDYGYMIAMVNGKTKRVPLGEVAGKLKVVDPDSQMIKEAKRTGICFGD